MLGFFIIGVLAIAVGAFFIAKKSGHCPFAILLFL